MSEPAIDLRDVFCVHRTDHGDAAALQGLSLTVARGERLCVLGPSGAGKTTLLRVIAGLQRPSAGVARVLGRDVGRLSARAAARERNRSIGFLHQRADSALSPDLTVGQAVGLPLALRGARRAERRARVVDLLTAAGLGDRADTLPGRLSGGERQRVAVCAAIAHRPQLLLADEPTAELDEASGLTIAELIEHVAAADGITVITVSHDATLATRTPRAVTLRDGRIVEDRDESASSLVVAPGGWLRLGGERLRQAGIGGRARAEVAGQTILLTPAHARISPKPVGPPAASLRPSAAQPTRVQLEAVTRYRGRGVRRRIVLDTLTLSFAPGRMTAVVGPSGSGKSTLLELVACLATVDAGVLLLDGERVGRPGADRLAGLRRARIGFLAQEPVPIGFLSAEENVALGLTAHGWTRAAAAQRARAALDEVGLAELRRQRVSRLSAGEAQRVALARALACANGLLVVDEPTSRLDGAGAAEIAALLRQAAEDDGHTVICATHDVEVARQADAIVRLGDLPRAGQPPARTALSSPD
jgi:ABC-type lipoprotein export system ATPase subunit